MIGQLLNNVEAIIAHSQDYPFDINAQELLNKWEKAKQPFIEAFDGQMIVRSERPIKIILSEEQQTRRFEDFIHTLDDNAILTEELEQFLKDNRDGFFDNQVVRPWPEKNIKPGAKLSRSFRRFLDAGPDVQCAQNIASSYIQENKIEGYLYLSVDPRDFLTISENNARWASCQSLDGEYRAGDLSYMVDKSTIVAYLSNGKQEQLKCMPKGMLWNSKKWRMLIHVGENSVYFNRQYPYFSSELMDEVHRMVLTYIDDYAKPFGFGFQNVKNQFGETLSLGKNYLIAGSSLIAVDEVVDTSDYLGYCDLISSTSYAPIVSVKTDRLNKYIPEFHEETRARRVEGFKKIFGIKIGDKVPCVCCGTGEVKRDCSFLCPECIAWNDADEDFFITCGDCGHRIYDEDEIFWENDTAFCKTCYNARKKEDIIKEDD